MSTSIAAKATKKVASKKAEPKETKTAKKKVAATKKTSKSTDEKKKPKKTISKVEQSEIIDSFLKENPSIKVEKQATNDELKDLSENIIDFPEEAITENLAVILENQEKNDLAIEVYEKLILKNPKKKAYFASQIQKIKKK